MAKSKSYIAKVNTKGQLVIPAIYRKNLGIDSETFLEMRVKDGGINISPIQDILTDSDYEETFSNILKKTKGSWEKPSIKDISIEEEKNKLELKESKRRKSEW